MTLLLKQLADKPSTWPLDLRGETVEVRSVPASISRTIETLLPYTPVHGDDEQAVAKRKASPQYQAGMRETDFHRQCLRAAYAAGIEHEGIVWQPDMSRADAKKLALGVAEILTDGEIGAIYQASYLAISKKLAPENLIGTEHNEGN